MKLEQSFEVAAPLERVWEALIDVERVAPCLPGASVTGRNDDGSYTGEFKVKIGPTSAAYSGKLNMETVDAEAHRATMQASGTDRRGQGGAKATIVSSVAEAGEGQTRVEVSTDYHITGRLARFGRGGMIEEISGRLLGEFATNLQRMLAGGAEAPAAEGGPDAAEPAAGDAAEAEARAAGDAAEAEACAAGDAAAAEAEAKARAAGDAAAAEAEAPRAEDASATEQAPLAERPPAEAATGEAPPAEAPPAEAPPTEAVAEEALASEAQPAEDPDAAIEGATPVASAAEEEPAEPSPAAAAPPPPPPPPSSAPESEPISALSLVGSVALKRAKENPAPLAALVIGFLAALRLLRRRS